MHIIRLCLQGVSSIPLRVLAINTHSPCQYRYAILCLCVGGGVDVCHGIQRCILTHTALHAHEYIICPCGPVPCNIADQHPLDAGGLPIYTASYCVIPVNNIYMIVYTCSFQTIPPCACSVYSHNFHV